MAAQLVADQGHVVVLHARNEARAEAARRALPAAADVLIVDLSTIASMRELAARANAVGRFDAVIHNVGIGYQEPHRVETADGLSLLWAVNVLAPYVLTAAMHRPNRLVYLSSGLSRRGNSDSTICNGQIALGTARRPIATPSCMTCCSRSASLAAGRTCCRTRSSRDGCRPEWAARKRPTTCRWLM